MGISQRGKAEPERPSDSSLPSCPRVCVLGDPRVGPRRVVYGLGLGRQGPSQLVASGCCFSFFNCDEVVSSHPETRIKGGSGSAVGGLPAHRGA